MNFRLGYNVVRRAIVQGPRVGAEGWRRQTKKRPEKLLYSFMSQENSDPRPFRGVEHTPLWGLLQKRSIEPLRSPKVRRGWARRAFWRCSGRRVRRPTWEPLRSPCESGIARIMGCNLHIRDQGNGASLCRMCFVCGGQGTNGILMSSRVHRCESRSLTHALIFYREDGSEV